MLNRDRGGLHLKGRPAILIKKGKAGKPLAPRAIESYLCALICFFSDVQKKPHQIGDGGARTLEVRFNPQEVFRLPSSLKRLIQPDPRDIDEVLWCKLTYAAATLQEEHIHSPYPVSYYRAAALLWVTSARRPNEIARLQVGCVRREWDPAMLDEDGLVEGIIDTRAARMGQPNVFFFLGRGADGKPRFCGNPTWDKCPL